MLNTTICLCIHLLMNILDFSPNFWLFGYYKLTISICYNSSSGYMF